MGGGQVKFFGGFKILMSFKKVVSDPFEAQRGFQGNVETYSQFAVQIAKRLFNRPVTIKAG